MSLSRSYILVKIVCVVSAWSPTLSIKVDVNTNEPLGPSGSSRPSPGPPPTSFPNLGGKGYSHTFVASPGVRKYTYGITHDPEGSDFSINFNPLDTDVDMDNYVHELRGFEPSPKYRQAYSPDYDEIQLKVKPLSHKEMKISSREVQGVHQEFGKRPLTPTKSTLIIHAPKPIAFEEMDLGLMGYGDFMDHESDEHDSRPTPQHANAYSPRPSPLYASPSPTPNFHSTIGPTALIRPNFGSSTPIQPGLGAYADGGTPKPLGLSAYSTPKPLGFSAPQTLRHQYFGSHGMSTPKPSGLYGFNTLKPQFPRGFSTPKPQFSYGLSTPKPQFTHGFRNPKPQYSLGLSTPKPQFPSGFSTPTPKFPHGFSSPRPLAGHHAMSTPKPLALIAHGNPSPTPIVYKARPTPIRFQQQPQVKFPQQTSKFQFPRLQDQRLVTDFKAPKLQYGFKPMKAQYAAKEPQFTKHFDDGHLNSLADEAFSKVFMSHNHDQEIPMVYTQHNHVSSNHVKHDHVNADMNAYLVPVYLMPNSEQIPSDDYVMNYHRGQ